MQRHVLPGTYHYPNPRTRHLGKLNDDYPISTTWIINRNLDDTQRGNFVNEVTNFCKQFNLSLEQIDKNHLRVDGNAINFNQALKIQLNQYETDENHFTGKTVYHGNLTPLMIPSQWKDNLENIIGLDNFPVSHPYFVLNKDVEFIESSRDIKPKASSTFTPLQLATLYNFPTGLDGTGQKIGIIELGGGYVMSDLTQYFSILGIQGTPKVNAISVGGATNNPGDRSGASVEVVLDIEVIMAIVPNATINVYFAPNTFQGFYNSINQAVNDGCNVVSISWGAAEVNWSSSMMNSFNSLFQKAVNKGCTILAAAGDNGSSDGSSGNNVDFPSSSPYCVACCGTALQANGNTIVSESVWNISSTTSATGGGISNVFSIPTYQNNITTVSLNGKRGVGDLAANASPATGYQLYMASQGGNIVVGGTSAVAPLISALVARINQSVGHNIGFIHPTLYSNPNICRDITVGNNGSFQAKVGWDCCTGNGVPIGTAWLSAFGGTVPSGSSPIAQFSATPFSGSAPLAVTFTDQSSNNPTSWTWNFGTGDTSNSQNPSYTFQNAGTFNVILTATNNYGSNSITKNSLITVTALPPPPAAPVTSFTSNKTTGTSPLNISFTDTSTNNPTSWLWNFGDNTTSQSKNPNHTYNNAGNYTVSLQTANAGGSNTLIKQNYITVHAITAPTASFSITTSTSGYAPLVVKFKDTSTGAPTSWLWTFGNGTTSSSQNPSCTYNSPGVYTVSLKTSNAGGSNTITKTNYINVRQPLPIASFSANVTFGKKPLSVTFRNTSTGATSYSWSFGDGTTSTLQSPVHTYSKSGSYSVSLTATNQSGNNVMTKRKYIVVN